MSSNVSVGTIVVAQMGVVQEAVKPEYTICWGTKGCSRGGIICGYHRGTGLTGAVAATHSVVVIAVLATSLRSPTEKQTKPLAPRRQNQIAVASGGRLS